MVANLVGHQSFYYGLIALVIGFSYYRSIQLRKKNKLLEEKVKHRTEQLQQSLGNLKSTQTQLVQQERWPALESSLPALPMKFKTR